MSQSVAIEGFDAKHQSVLLRAMVRPVVLGVFVGFFLVAQFTGFSSWMLGYCLGAGLGCFNLFTKVRLSRDALRAAGDGRRPSLVGVIVLFTLRLAVTGGLLFVALAWFDLPPYSILAGISAVLPGTLWWAFQQSGLQR